MIELNTSDEFLRTLAAQTLDWAASDEFLCTGVEIPYSDIVPLRQALEKAADDWQALFEYAERLERQQQIASADIRRLQDAAKDPGAAITRFIQQAVSEQLEEQTEDLSDKYGNLVAEVEDLQSTVEDLRNEVRSTLSEDDVDDRIRDYLRHEATFEVSISVD